MELLSVRKPQNHTEKSYCPRKNEKNEIRVAIQLGLRLAAMHEGVYQHLLQDNI